MLNIVRQEGNSVPFYCCDDSSWSGAAHGFSTRLGGCSPAPWCSLNLGSNLGDDPARVDENFRRFCAALGTSAANIVKNKQVHSCLIRRVGRDDAVRRPSDPAVFSADGLVTNEPGVCLTVFSGDCIPVLLYDPVARCIAAAHAGWRGAAGGIAAQAVSAMTEHYGSRPENVLAAIGPGIGPCCFETHVDVPDAIRTQLGAEAEAYITSLPQPGKFHVDLKSLNAHWLRKAGVSSDHIALCGRCTACGLDEFWSHRIQGRERGSMAAMIQLI